VCADDESKWQCLYLRKLSWPEIEEAVKTIRIILLPVGSLEQHGPHLPIDVDTATVEYLAHEATLLASRSLGKSAAVIGPSLPFGGPGLGMDGWPGTIRLKPEVFLELYKDIGGCLAEAGFRYVVTLNGCYGNVASLTLACQLLKGEYAETQFLVLDSVWADQGTIAEVRQSDLGGTGHAGEVETSIALAIDPEHVDMDKAVDELPRHPSPRVTFDFKSVNPYHWPVPFKEMTSSGVMGRATLGTREKGEKILQAAAQRISKILIELQELE
jgi:creatinine amidohydrolase